MSTAEQIVGDFIRIFFYVFVCLAFFSLVGWITSGSENRWLYAYGGFWVMAGYTSRKL